MEEYIRVKDVVQFIQDHLLLDENFFCDGEAIALILQYEKVYYLSKGITGLDIQEMDDLYDP